jgi:hypothetical protein
MFFMGIIDTWRLIRNVSAVDRIIETRDSRPRRALFGLAASRDLLSLVYDCTSVSPYIRASRAFGGGCAHTATARP